MNAIQAPVHDHDRNSSHHHHHRSKVATIGFTRKSILVSFSSLPKQTNKKSYNITSRIVFFVSSFRHMEDNNGLLVAFCLALANAKPRIVSRHYRQLFASVVIPSPAFAAVVCIFYAAIILKNVRLIYGFLSVARASLGHPSTSATTSQSSLVGQEFMWVALIVLIVFDIFGED